MWHALAAGMPLRCGSLCPVARTSSVGVVRNVKTITFRAHDSGECHVGALLGGRSDCEPKRQPVRMATEAQTPALQMHQYGPATETAGPGDLQPAPAAVPRIEYQLGKSGHPDQLVGRLAAHGQHRGQGAQRIQRSQRGQYPGPGALGAIRDRDGLQFPGRSVDQPGLCARREGSVLPDQRRGAGAGQRCLDRGPDQPPARQGRRQQSGLSGHPRRAYMGFSRHTCKNRSQDPFLSIESAG